MTICPDCSTEHLGGPCGYGSLMERLRAAPPANGFTPSRSLGAGRTAGRTEQRKHYGRLERYRQARADGIQPASTKTRDIDRALAVSDRTQTGFRADAASIRKRAEDKAAASA